MDRPFWQEGLQSSPWPIDTATGLERRLGEERIGYVAQATNLA